jgi:hypothetical protein
VEEGLAGIIQAFVVGRETLMFAARDACTDTCTGDSRRAGLEVTISKLLASLLGAGHSARFHANRKLAEL